VRGEDGGWKMENRKGKSGIAREWVKSNRFDWWRLGERRKVRAFKVGRFKSQWGAAFMPLQRTGLCDCEIVLRCGWAGGEAA